MNREKAIYAIMNSIKEEDIVVSTTGLISREIFEKFDSCRNIYVPGSMGLASSIGLGIAVARKDKRIVIIDGDASILMNLGSMVTMGNNCPKNVLHIVLDNEAYASCSEEKSMSSSANLDKVALAVGYRYIRVTSNSRELKYAILSFRKSPGFILAKIKLGGRRDFIRPLDLIGIKKRFFRFLEKPNH